MSCFVRILLALALAVPAGALAQIEPVHVEEVDAGIHQPVVTKLPQLVHEVKAVYPPEEVDAGLTVHVKMQITIEADGGVGDVKVTDSAGPAFDASAVAAVKQFTFSPAEVDGVPAAIQIEYGITFNVEQKPVEKPPEAPPPTATLNGQVLARGSRKRVGGAVLRCGEAQDAPETTSDDDGKFKFEVPPGDCMLIVVANGYERSQTMQVLKAGDVAEVNVFLLPKPGKNETVVHGQKDKVEVTIRSLDREELIAVPGSMGDPIRVIQDLPGVARAPFNSGQLIVRGSNPADTDTQLDGVSIPILYHLGFGPSVLNPNFLDHLDFFPGGFGARYGRAIGGIVDVYTRRGAADTFHGEAEVSLKDSSVFVEAPIAPGISVAGAARRSYIDALLPLVLPNGLVAIPYYWDYQFRVDVGPPKGQALGNGQSSFYLMAFGSNDELRLITTGSGIDAGRNISLNVHTLFHDVKGDWTFKLGNLTSVFTPYVGYTQLSFGIGTTTLGVDDYTFGAREDLRWAPNNYFTLRTGFDLVADHYNGHASLPVISGVQIPERPGADGQPTATQEIQMTFNSADPGIYAEADFKYGKLTFTPGVRFNYDRNLGHEISSIDPRLWMRYQLSDRTELKGSVGLYSESPPTQDFVAPPFGNPGLQEERAFQTSLGVKHKFTDLINVDLTGFYNRRYDLVVQNNPTITNPDGSVTNLLYSNDGLGRAYGLELWVRHEWTKSFYGWIAYTLSRSEVRNRGDTNYVLSTFDQTHILTVVASYTLPFWGVMIGGRFQYVTGNTYTPCLHPYDVQYLDGNGYVCAETAPDHSGRRPDFNELDLRIDKNWVFDRWTLDAFLEIWNVYNERNVETSFSDYRFRVAYDVPGLPFLPIMGVKGKF